jgi:PAS domain S-box-containing protein
MVKLPIVGRVMSLVRKEPPKRMAAARDDRLRRALENAPAGVAFASADGHWLQLNERLRTMLGYTREELGRITFNSITHPDDARKELALIKRVIHGDVDSYRIHKRTMDKTGAYRMLHVRASLVRNAAGEPDFFVYFVEADEPRGDPRNDASQSIIDQLEQVAVIRVDTKGVITGWNAGATRIFGYTSDEIIGKNRRTLYRDADTWHGRPTSEIKRAAEGRIEAEDWRVTKSGEHLWVNVAIMPFVSETGARSFIEIVGPATAGKAIDTKPMIEQLRAEIDKRSRTEESLRDALEELRLVSEETLNELKIMTVALRNEIERRKTLEDELRSANEKLAAVPPPPPPEEEVEAVDVEAFEWQALAGSTIDVLRDIAAEERTGTFIIVSDEHQKELFFEKGRVFSCASNDEKLFLAERLVAAEVITEDQRAKALEIKQETQLALGRILLILGAIDETQLVEAMRSKMRDEVAQLATWTTAQWTFVDGEVPSLKLVPLRIDIEELLAPAPRPVVASPKAKKYHLEDCISVKRIAKKSRVHYASEAEAMTKGLTACRMCVPS